MTNQQTGWIVFIAACGMMFGLLSVDVSHLATWHEVSTPGFIADLFGHIAAVITAFVGGKLIPENRDVNKKTRSSD